MYAYSIKIQFHIQYWHNALMHRQCLSVCTLPMIFFTGMVPVVNKSVMWRNFSLLLHTLYTNTYLHRSNSYLKQSVHCNDPPSDQGTCWEMLLHPKMKRAQDPGSQKRNRLIQWCTLFKHFTKWSNFARFQYFFKVKIKEYVQHKFKKLFRTFFEQTRRKIKHMKYTFIIKAVPSVGWE